jgi:hypothetical protein
MINREELCDKIRSIYPEIGECGMNVEVQWDGETKAWVVDLSVGDHELQTYLEPDDVEACMAGKQCVNLGVQIAQLKSNVQTA